METGSALREPLISHEIERLSSLSMSTGGRKMISRHIDRRIRLWDMETRAIVESVSGSSSEFYFEEEVAMSSNGETVLSCNGEDLQVWNRSQVGNGLSYLLFLLFQVF